MSKDKMLSPWVFDEIALGWEDTLHIDPCGRLILGGGGEMAVWGNDSVWHADLNADSKGDWIDFATKEEAMTALDEKLLEDGWTFLTQEQWDKYQILL